MERPGLDVPAAPRRHTRSCRRPRRATDRSTRPVERTVTTVGQLVLTVGAHNPLYVNTPRVADDRSRSRRVSDLLARAARPGLDVVWASSSPKMSSPKEPK